MGYTLEKYTEFLNNKIDIVEWQGFEAQASGLHWSTKQHQALAVKWALKIGRGLLAKSFGLGKTHDQIEIGKQVHKHTGRQFIVVCPLGVRYQFMYEDGPRLDIEFDFVQTDYQVQQAKSPYLITNYESLREGKINPDKHNFGGVSLDEGSVLRSLGSKTYQEFMRIFDKTTYRWVCTATPSPNNFKEILGYADFLGIMDRGQALAQPLDAGVLTPDGYELMRNIYVGDKVATVDGSFANVIGVYPQGYKNIYKVSFSDGSSTECTDEHLWFTHTGNQRRAERRFKLRNPEFDGTYGTVKELKEIKNTLLEGKRGDINHSIPLVNVIQFDKKETSLDPYLLGVLLGDGHFRETSITFSSADQWIVDEIQRILDKNYNGYVNIKYVNHKRKDGQPCYDYSINSGEGRQHNPVLTAIREDGLTQSRSWDKWIPENYLYNTPMNRLAILQGLMDTDGTICKNRTIRFLTTSPRLADNVKFLVQSFGGTAAIYKNFGTTPSGNIGRMQYRLTIRLPNGINPFRLPRKANLVTPKEKYPPVRYIINVEYIGQKEAQCIAIDHPSHLYLTDDCLVTHNTRFFMRNPDKAGDLRLIPHREDQFWLWVASWALFIYKPSDLGFSDEGYELPKMHVNWHRLPVDHSRAFEQVDSWGQHKMFLDAAGGIGAAMIEKRATIDVRVKKVQEIITQNPNDHYLVWHDLEDERKAIQKAIPASTSVYGSQPLETREQNILDFSHGKLPILSTKPQIAGSGCNFQYHCNRAIFMGIGYKFQDFIQAIHRIWRFQQYKEVYIDIIYVESEDSVQKVLLEKWENHNKLVKKMQKIIKKNGLTHFSIHNALKRHISFERDEHIGKGGLFRIANTDSVLELYDLVDAMEKGETNPMMINLNGKE